MAVQRLIVLDGAQRAASGGGPLAVREVATPWAPELSVAMRDRGVAVHEEQVVEVLLWAWGAP